MLLTLVDSQARLRLVMALWHSSNSPVDGRLCRFDALSLPIALWYACGGTVTRLTPVSCSLLVGVVRRILQWKFPPRLDVHQACGQSLGQG
mmetsp:Transcript_36911/g.83001  ORF Transcript_36911/g.83001 Transcript_36911/m.83001 type:complete len:91 (+) Transcript_36911:2231-2503(+)